MIWRGLDTSRDYGFNKAIIPMIVRKFNVRIMAEIGVLRGELSYNVLTTCPDLTEYYMVDPWHVVEGNTIWSKMVQGEWDAIHDHVAEKFAQFPRARIVRQESCMAALTFEDGYLDFVYIDGLHAYENVKEDILAWLPKVKPDGLIGGDDYGRREFPGVRQAVHEVFPERLVRRGQPLQKWGYTWLVSKREWLNTRG